MPFSNQQVENGNSVKERVQKLMAQADLGSRRACEDYIRQGRVRVNGKVIHLGDQADPTADIIEFDGQKLAFPERKIYYAFNKPKNVLSTDEPHDGDNRRTVRNYIPYDGHLFNVGRLDADSEGLMVLTNDGDLANRLSHPRYRHSKTYKVVVRGLPSPESLERWEKGVFLEEEDGTQIKTAPCFVKIVEGGAKETTLRIVMTEGKKRQIRRTAVSLGHPVISLIRTQIGRLMLGTLHSGEWRELNSKDVTALRTSSEELPEGASGPKIRRPPRKRAAEPEATEKRTPRGRKPNPINRPTKSRRQARTENQPSQPRRKSGRREK